TCPFSCPEVRPDVRAGRFPARTREQMHSPESSAPTRNKLPPAALLQPPRVDVAHPRSSTFASNAQEPTSLMFKLYPSSDGLVIEQDGRWLRPRSRIDWDAVFTQDDPLGFVRSAAASADALSGAPDSGGTPLLTSQEVWAAGVTYLRSRTARMEESKDAGGGSFYDKVYVADRPELFFKSTRSRVAAPGAAVRIRADSKWNVPEPELTLAISAKGRIFGYTVGNDMSSRDIEGENPLYLPQAKVYAGSASLGPCLLVTD